MFARPTPPKSLRSKFIIKIGYLAGSRQPERATRMHRGALA
jgi:hypothetical protein